MENEGTINYERLAHDQFRELKEETLDDDRHCVGAANEKDYEDNGVSFTIHVDGFWEKSEHFKWRAEDEGGNILGAGDYDD